jgi:hypothetical protein
MEACGLRQDRKLERQRLANLSVKQHHAEGDEEIGAHTVAMPVSGSSSMFDDDKDNYLRGQLIHGNNVVAERHNRQTVSHWLHAGECLGCKTNGTYRDHDCGMNSEWDKPVTYEKNESRLVDFSEIGLGLDLDCLSSFVNSNDDPEQERQPRVSDYALKKTVQDLPALQFDFKRVELIQTDATNRQSNSRES